MSDSDLDDILAHYGVMGMKWGVRKDDEGGGSSSSSFKSRYREIRNAPLKTLTVKAKNGATVTLNETPKASIAAFIGAASGKKGVESMKAYSDYTITVDGKKVGNASFNKVNKDEINLVWLGVNKDARGKGYGSATFESAIAYGKQEGAKRLTLEVPGNAPDARHIYEKNGFRVTKEDVDPDDSVWGGLTYMQYDFNKPTIKHGVEDDELERAFDQTFPKLPKSVLQEDESIAQSDSDLDDILAHYGVIGMKWGVRKDRGDRDATFRKRAKEKNPVDVSVSQQPGKYVKGKGGQNQPASEDAITAATYRQRAKASTPDSLSNKELQTLVTRMNLEQQYNNLTSQSDRRSRGAKLANQIVGNDNPFRDTTLSNIDKRNANLGRKVRFVATAIDWATSGPKKKKKK